jgi:sterol desaturase/sphingolipid hydroxylase (fatty acid hydroxylase superfamily)
MFHAVPGLWRLHRMHLTGLERDSITGLRLEPIDILISTGINLAVVAALGLPDVAVLLFVVLLIATAMFSHANINPPRPEACVRLLSVVFPDRHMSTIPSTRAKPVPIMAESYDSARPKVGYDAGNISSTDG